MRDRKLHSARSAYHQIRVVDEEGRRVLYFQGNPQSRMDRGDPAAGGLEYATYVHCAWALAERIRQVLVIGLGGGSLPKEFLRDYPEVRVDVVEIDPAVVQVAYDYFELPVASRLRVVVADAREFLRRTRRRYDFILMDAYLNDKSGRLLIPPHLATLQFMRLAAARLTPAGWLGYNVTGTLSGPDSKIAGALLRTMGEVFPQRCAFDMEEDLNLVLFAGRRPPVPTKTELRRRLAKLLTEGVLKRPEIRNCVGHYHGAGLPASDLVLLDPGAEVPELMGCSL